jgi:hypothetical protein
MTKQHIHNVFSITSAVGAFLLMGVALAQPGPPPGHGGRRGPPTEAFDACKGKKAGDACSVRFGEHERPGKCALFPDRDGAGGDDKKGALACRPTPPPELTKACEGKTAGDACAATFGERKLEGTCHEGPDAALMCRPARRGPGRHERP